MLLRRLAALFATVTTLTFTQFIYAAPGDILQTLTIKNNFNFIELGGGVDISDVGPTSPHGIAFHDGFLYVLDFGTDRIYKVYPEQVIDEDGTVHEAGDSDFNFPVSEPNDDGHLLDPAGNPLPTCGAYPENTQYCGGGGLDFVNPYLWNASPVTDQIIKIDITTGDVITDNETLNVEQFPSPTSLAYDNTFFWVLDWQSNSINKVNPTTGATLASYDAGSSTITGTRPVGIVWDKKDLWISYEDDKIIYRVKPNDTTQSLDILDSFSAPGSSDPLSKPKDLAFDGDFLWHADSGTGKIYKLETDINPFGIIGCIEKNGIGINSAVLLKQTGAGDQIDTTSAGCFQFQQFLPGVQIALEFNEAGVSGKPHITLNETEPGSTDVTLSVGDIYDENNYGFIATDLEDDDSTLTLAVTTTPNVTTASPIGLNINTSTPNPTGITVAYNVIDSEGNHAETAYRTIYVLEADVAPPIITLNGSSAMTIEQDTSNANLYIEPGAYAEDNQDDNSELTQLITINGSVNSSIAGEYIITYNVADEAGNNAVEVIRTITVKDTTTAAITVIEDNPANNTIEKGTPYTEMFAQVIDNVEGTITLDASHTTGTVDTNTVGVYTINYSYTDTGNNTATANRTVSVIDTEAPIINLRGDATVNHELNTIYTDAGATAVDSTGELISSNVPFTGSVDVSQSGTYTLTYNISDTSNNPALEVTRDVNVVDTGTPTLTLIGNPTINLQRGEVYIEQGATASDAVDDDATLTASIVISGDNVDTSTNGQYQVVYNVTDSALNAAPSLTRTINVLDTGLPVISLIGNQTIFLQKDDIYNEQGATATDAADDDTTLTESIVITGDVDTSINGSYIRYYNVSDSTGNAAITVTRIIDVADTGKPVITLNGNQTINLQTGDTYTELGATATDSVDNDATLTASILIESNVNTSNSGTYTVTYSVSDSTGNAATPVTRTIIVSDTDSPVITLIGNQTINLQTGDTYIEQGATATDAVDDNTTLTANIEITGSVNTNINGTYSITYSVSDSAGNPAISVIRTVNVDDTGTPVISLIGNQTINLQQGDTYIEQGATATDAVDDDATLTSNISQTGTVNTGVIGSYTRTYNVSDSAGNAATPAIRIINVMDTGIPIITLNGNNIIDHEQGTPFTDPGATAFDSVDGDMGTITAPETVDTSITNTQILTYNISDIANNAAIEVTRVINVADRAAPIITLTGNANINLEQGTAYTEAGATALDTVDGIVPATPSGTVAFNTAGIYTINYDAIDAAGNNASTVTRTVNVADTIAPIITLLGDISIDIPIGQLFVDPGFTASDNFDGTITANVNTTGTIDVDSEGTYTLNYDVSDAGLNAALTVTRTINVINPTEILIEAETTTSATHTVGTDIANMPYSGLGYIEHPGEGDIEYTFNASGLSYDLVAHYALDTGSRPLEVILNGISLSNLEFPATGSFATWSDTDPLTITPLSGLNTIIFRTNLSGAANIDFFTLTPQ